MIRRLVEELERSQLEVQELRHDLREEKKKIKDFQTLLEDMVISSTLSLSKFSGRQDQTAKRRIRQRTPITKKCPRPSQ